uniref:Alkyl transferase n=1 Tax=Kalanchoe fedtschenkoi TaxID=63787 RepID=A0A7N0THC4_KALFE
MEEDCTGDSPANSFVETVIDFVQRCLLGILSVGPIPSHIAFIMDGNRRYEKTHNLSYGMGHRAGYVALMNLLKYCYRLGVKYVTVYAFSIDNFKRPPEEVQNLMQLLQEKIESLLKAESIVHKYGIRVHFIGNLKLLDESVRLAAEKAMKATACHNKAVLSICIAYTSTNEVLHAVQVSCRGACSVAQSTNGSIEGVGFGMEKQENQIISLVDIEKRMYMAVAPDPDIVIRSSGETRLSNFLLWQTGCSILHTTAALWPEVGLGHLVWATSSCHPSSPSSKLALMPLVRNSPERQR